MSTDAPTVDDTLADTQVTATADVLVTVSANGDVTCSPDPLVVKNGHTTISFRMGTAGWNFVAQNAIVVSPPNANFPNPSKTLPGGRLATLLDLDSSSGSFSYTVNVYQLSTGRCVSHDPTIENQAN